MVSCSNCGQEFDIPGQVYGFSHCDLHDQYEPLPDDGLIIVIPARKEAP